MAVAVLNGQESRDKGRVALSATPLPSLNLGKPVRKRPWFAFYCGFMPSSIRISVFQKFQINGVAEHSAVTVSPFGSEVLDCLFYIHHQHRFKDSPGIAEVLLASTMGLTQGNMIAS